jgi:hypothetical protein
MASLILIFVVGMTILMLQFDRGMHQLRNKATASEKDGGRPRWQNRNKPRGFGFETLIRGFAEITKPIARR